MRKLTNNKGAFDHKMAFGYLGETQAATKDYIYTIDFFCMCN